MVGLVEFPDYIVTHEFNSVTTYDRQEAIFIE